MKVRRVISIYDKVEETLIKEIELTIALHVIKEILNPHEDDSNLFKIYRINQEQFHALSKIVPNLSEVDFFNFDIFYECFTY